jgi:hypothetical protein
MPQARGKQQAGEAPRPQELPKEQLARPGQQPGFVPWQVQRRGSQATTMTGGRPSPSSRPNQLGRVSFEPGREQGRQHVPRAFQEQAGARAAGQLAQSQPRQQRAGAFYGGTTVVAQWSVDYPDDIWFYDANAGWVPLDGSSENGLELMNEVVCVARQTGATLYYDTNDTTGNVVDVYVF